MKKLLLSALLLGAGVSLASAQSFKLYLSKECENYQVKNFQLINEGDVFVVDEMEIDAPIQFGDFYMQKAECMAYAKVQNTTSSKLSLSLGYEVESSECNAEELGVTESYMTCLGGSCVATNPMPVTVDANSETPGIFGEHLGYEFSANAPDLADKVKINAKYNFTLSAGSEALHFTILYKAGDASVGTIGAEAGEAAYYNLQGIRVATPEAGQLYIKRQGGKSAKVIF